MSVTADQIYDIAVIGGGVNGCGIARDAAGRGAKVLLLEAGDLAGGTSSASTKQENRRRASNRVENSHLTIRNHFNSKRHLVDRQTFRERRSVAWQSLVV